MGSLQKQKPAHLSFSNLSLNGHHQVGLLLLGEKYDLGEPLTKAGEANFYISMLTDSLKLCEKDFMASRRRNDTYVKCPDGLWGRSIERVLEGAVIRREARMWKSGRRDIQPFLEPSPHSLCNTLIDSMSTHGCNHGKC